MTESLAGQAASRGGRRHQLHLLVLGAGVAVAAVVVAWLLLKEVGGSPSPALKSGPAIVSEAQLERFAGSLDYPVYWAGPKPGFSYELTSAKGRVWVRYLPADVKAGDARSDFLVVGTYEQPHSYSSLQRAAGRPGGVARPIPDGGLLVFNSQKPTSVYFSYPGVTYQVEVYARSSKTARSLVLDGKITPVK
jgi:hypothetical protein